MDEVFSFFRFFVFRFSFFVFSVRKKVWKPVSEHGKDEFFIFHYSFFAKIARGEMSSNWP